MVVDSWTMRDHENHETFFRVRATHLPSGESVVAQNKHERSAREMALRDLFAKVEGKRR
jgi:protein subunit release factor A